MRFRFFFLIDFRKLLRLVILILILLVSTCSCTRPPGQLPLCRKGISGCPCVKAVRSAGGGLDSRAAGSLFGCYEGQANGVDNVQSTPERRPCWRPILFIARLHRSTRDLTRGCLPCLARFVSSRRCQCSPFQCLPLLRNDGYQAALTHIVVGLYAVCRSLFSIQASAEAEAGWVNGFQLVVKGFPRILVQSYGTESVRFQNAPRPFRALLPYGFSTKNHPRFASVFFGQNFWNGMSAPVAKYQNLSLTL